MPRDDDDDDDEFTRGLEQVGSLSFMIWPHIPSLHYDLPRRLQTAASNYLPERPTFEKTKNELKSFCMEVSDSLASIISEAIDNPFDGLNEPEPAGVELIKEPKKVPSLSDRLVNYDHLTYLTFEQFQDETFLRNRIKEILQLDLSPMDQRYLIQRLMSRTYREKQRYEQKIARDGNDDSDGISASDSGYDSESESESESDADEDEVVISSKDRVPSYYRPGILGCTHYQTNCKVECALCSKWFPCRFCHDAQVSDHRMPRKMTRHVLCMFCNTPQFPSQYCVGCGKELARYYCHKCKLFDNDPLKHIYHCDDCGICRLGLGLNQDYFHCNNCNACISIELRENHVCIENATHSNCPICDEYMFDSNKTVVFMSCGHPIHQQCYDEYTRHSYKCPLCSKTVVNMEAQFRVLDKEIAETVMPEEMRDWQAIIKCTDCGGRSKVPYHYLGLRCEHCKSYNTMQLKILKGSENDRDAATESTDEPKAVIPNNLGQNFVFLEEEQGTAAGVEQSYAENFVNVVNRFEKYSSLGEAFRDWMSQNEEATK